MTLTRTVPPPLYTYPARPLNGGPFDKAPPKRGAWAAEPKFNGWRALVHIPSGTIFNRHGERNPGAPADIQLIGGQMAALRNPAGAAPGAAGTRRDRRQLDAPVQQ